MAFNGQLKVNGGIKEKDSRWLKGDTG